MNSGSITACPRCGEPTKPSWRICPVCETRLKALTCHQCGGEVQERWRRCPDCEAQLVCRQCNTRLMPGQSACPQCQPVQQEVQESRLVIKEPVCGIEFVLVRGGTFAMGDTVGQGAESEQPVHQVTLDDFYISGCPVTQMQWLVLMKENPSGFQHADHPVEQVTWTDAGVFAIALSEAAHKNIGYMLPTEAQWEYAARSGGADDLYAGGDDIEAVAWYEGNSNGSTHPVGRKASNALGIYDMSGNVWEWCRDTYRSDAYERHGSRNPIVGSNGSDRVIRGGSWNLDAWSARCTRRFNFRADFHGPGLGFRLVMLNV